MNESKIVKSNILLTFVTFATIVLAISCLFCENNIFVSATDKVDGSITFSRSTGTQNVISNDYYYTSGTTDSGHTVYLRNASKASLGSNYVAVMCGTNDKGSVEPSLTITSSNLVKNESLFEFQYIKEISGKIDSASTRTMTVSKSYDGENWESAGNLAVSSSGGSNTDVLGAKYIKLEYCGYFNANFTEFTISYGCSSSGHYDLINAGTYRSANYVFTLNSNGTGNYLAFTESNYIEFTWEETNGSVLFEFNESTIDNENTARYMPYRDVDLNYLPSIYGTVLSEDTFSCVLSRQPPSGTKTTTMTFTRGA